MLGIKTLLISSALGIAMGASTMLVYEHNVPWGLAKRLDRMEKDMPGKLFAATKAGADAQFEKDKATIDKEWRPALQQCRDDRKKDSETAGAKIDAAMSQQTASRTAAYRLGQASCGARNAKTPDPGAGDSPPSGSLPDDTDLGAVLGPAAYAPKTSTGRSSGR